MTGSIFDDVAYDLYHVETEDGDWCNFDRQPCSRREPCDCCDLDQDTA